MSPSQGEEEGSIPLSRSRVKLARGFEECQVRLGFLPVFFIEKRMTFQTNHFYVYTLFSLRDKRLYTGFTSNLRNRLSQHARGEVKSTKDRRPLKLIHYDYFINEEDAKSREVFLKSGFGRNELKKALKRTLKEFLT